MLRERILRHAIAVVCQRPAGNRIPLTSPEADDNNVYTARAKIEDDDYVFVVTGNVLSEGIEGIWFNKHDQGGKPCVLLNRALTEFTFRISHYYRGFEIYYFSPWRFLMHHYTYFAWFILWRDRIAQAFFNRKRLVRKDRMDALRYIYEQTLRDRTFQTSGFDLMTKLYTKRWIRHPRQQEMHSYYNLLLDALCEDGDIKRGQYSYTLEPRALRTLSEFEEDERRHRDNKRHQTILAILTAALILVGLPQAISSGVQAYRHFVASDAETSASPPTLDVTDK